MSDRFSDPYKEQTFFLWYEGGRRVGNPFINSLPADESGNVPTHRTLEIWRDTFGWVSRAEELDAELSKKLQDEVIDKRVKMYEHHIEVSNALIEKGEVYLREHPLDSASDALKAIDLGIEIQKASVGQVELGRKILTMSDDQLERELLKLVGKSKEPVDEFIDAEAKEVEEEADD